MQRASEKQLQIETIDALNDVQKTLETKQLSSISGEIIESPEKDLQKASTPIQQIVEIQPVVAKQSVLSGSMIRDFRDPSLPTQEAATVNSNDSQTSGDFHTSSWPHALNTFVVQPQIPTQLSPEVKDRPPSPRSVSSADSFQSAEETNIGIAQDIKAVQGVLHTFKFALEVLEKLVQKQIPKEQNEILLSAQHLNVSLERGKRAIRDTHQSCYESYGQRYIFTFTEMGQSAKFPSVKSIIVLTQHRLNRFPKHQFDPHERSSDGPPFINCLLLNTLHFELRVHVLLLRNLSRPSRFRDRKSRCAT
jgi:hypothetical protein